VINYEKIHSKSATHYPPVKAALYVDRIPLAFWDRTMGKVVIDMSMSLDGFVTGPGHGPRFPLGEHGARRLFDGYFRGQSSFEGQFSLPAWPTGNSEFIFVSEGIRAGVARARALAGDKRIAIGGASIAQQALQAGLVDEIYLHIAPIILGMGKRLFDQVGPRSIQLKHLDALDTSDAQHIRYEVVRNES
jgi:hypothetical protein